MQSTRLRAVAALLLVFVFTWVNRADAQGQQGSIEGRISDSQQLPLTQVVVELQSSQGASLQKVLADGSGRYKLTDVPAGSFTVQFTRSGFAALKKTSVAVAAGQDLVLDAILQPQGIVESITVVASVDNDRFVATKSEIPLQETPITVQTVPLAVIQEQRATDVVDVVNNIPGAYAFQQYGVYDYFVFRGFQLDKDPGSAILLNGMRLEGNRVSSQLNSIESVEVLKGPASMLYGTQATGGTVNIVQKQPLATRAYEVVVQGGRWGRGGIELAATGPLGSDKLLYRMDAGFLRSDGFRHAGFNRVNVSPTVYWRMSSRDQLNLHVIYNQDYSRLDAGIPLLPTLANPDFATLIPNVPLDRRYNVPGSFGKSQMPIFQAFYQHSLTERLRIREAFQYQYMGDEYFESEGLTVDPADFRTVTRENLYFHHFNNAITSQTDLAGDFNLGWKHQFIIGYEYDQLHHNTKRSAVDNDDEPSIDLYNPVETGVATTVFPSRGYDGFQNTSNALYFQDYVRVHPKVQFLVSGRYDSYSQHRFRNRLSGGVLTITPPSDISQNPFTYRVAVNAQVLPALSLYSSYGTSFTAQEAVNGNGLPFTPSGVPFKPTSAGQFEAGARLSLMQNRVSLEATYFDIRQKNALIFISTTQFEQAGKQNSHGFEFEARARASQRLNFFVNYGFTQAVFADFVTPDFDFTGRTPSWVPKHTVRMWSSYDLPKGFGVSLGMRYVSKRSPSSDNSLFFGGYTTWDTAFRYRRARMEYSVNIVNLLNKTNYFVSAIGFNQLQVYPGTPLDVSATARYRF